MLFFVYNFGTDYNKGFIMRFFKNLKTKITNRLEKPVFSDVKTMPDEDVALLAIMCKMCSPVVTKRHIFIHVLDLYAYYAPQSESDINIAKDIFARNGIQMDVHDSRIFGDERQPVLRINYAMCTNKNKLVQEMTRIEQKYYSLYTAEARSEKAILWRQLMELRQNQKQ